MNSKVNQSGSASIARAASDEFHVVIASAGRRVYLVEWFREALAELGLGGKIITTDASASSTALSAGDLALLMPPYSSPDYDKAMVAMVREHKPRLIISLNDYEIEYMSRGLGSRLESLGAVVPGIPAGLIAVVTDKFACASYLANRGIFTPETKLGSTVLCGEEMESSGPEFIVKHRWGSGSSGLKVAQRKDLEAAIEQSMADAPRRGSVTPEQSVVVQPKVEGTEFGIDVVGSMTRRDGLAGVLARKKLRMRAGETDQALSVNPAPFRSLGYQLYKALEPVGLIDVDVLVDDSGEISVIDVNPRFGGGYPFNHIAGAQVPKMYLEDVAFGVRNDEYLTYRPDVTGGKYEGVRQVDTQVSKIGSGRSHGTE